MLNKILILERETGKTGPFSYFWYNLTKLKKIFLVFMAILVHNSAQNYIKQNSDRAKEFTFRMSETSVCAAARTLVVELDYMVSEGEEITKCC